MATKEKSTMPGIAGTMKEYKAGTLHSGSKTGPKVTKRSQEIAIGMSEERKMKGKDGAGSRSYGGGGGKRSRKEGNLRHFGRHAKHRIEHHPGGNHRIDMGSAGEAMSRDEQQMVPDSEMHSAPNSPSKMAPHEMYAPADPRHHLHSLAEHHAKEAAKYAGMGAEHREMSDHHRGMAEAFRANLRTPIHAGEGDSKSESGPPSIGSHSFSDSVQNQFGHKGGVGYAGFESLPGMPGGHTPGGGKNQLDHRSRLSGSKAMRSEPKPSSIGGHTSGKAANQPSKGRR